jgi:hypothetical protein
LANDSRKKFGYIFTHTSATDNEGVALHSRLDLRVGEVKDRVVVSEHIDLFDAGDDGGTELLHNSDDLLVV